MAGFSIGIGGISGFKVAQARMAGAVKNHQRRAEKVVRRVALMAEREIKLGLKSGAPGGEKFKPLAASTLLLRTGSKPLLDTGSLLRSVSTTYEKSTMSAFVGVHRTKKAADGRSVLNLAIIHEFGTKPFVIEVTDGVRRLFWYLHFASNGAINPLSPNKTQIAHPGVPARPFIRPTITKIRPKLQAEVAKVYGANGGPI